ncbi:hypothetical protein [Paenibacillus sp. LHD-38]|uniref:hypothetical protein n=1 Tax=Paenibacillus sp. LHD-38 TaxID=3072143 RepID=UPI00280EF80A|nr:hypothetical protein [Paenibacillus sp. LHD-38]MDQ8739090.1 hypothetical protein [Paenibacillus sp. LHD-38]
MDTLIGLKIINFCDCLGTYGMGGPGFFGLLIERENMKEYLTYAVWASSEYIAIDNRVLECHINYNALHRPWKSQWPGESEENQWDELSEILNGSTIIGVDLTDSQLTIEILSKEAKHILNFYKYNKKLPPHGNGEARIQAFNEGNLGSYIVFCNEDAVLHV